MFLVLCSWAHRVQVPAEGYQKPGVGNPSKSSLWAILASPNGLVWGGKPWPGCVSAGDMVGHEVGHARAFIRAQGKGSAGEEEPMNFCTAG